MPKTSLTTLFASNPLAMAKSNPSKNLRKSSSTLLGLDTKSLYMFSINTGEELVINEKSFIINESLIDINN